MRGKQSTQNGMFAYFSMESLVPEDHVIRQIATMIGPILEEMDDTFENLYSKMGRPGIPAEQLLKALMLQVLFTIRSERQLVEQLRYNFLYRWFVGLGAEDKVWDATTFTKNRRRLLEGKIADAFFSRVVGLADKKKLISKEHFSVDGSLVHAWASLKSFQKKEDERADKDEIRGEDAGGGGGGSRNENVDFKGERRTNKTHESTTDPEARLYTKSPGQAAVLNFMGHVAMENRNGLAIDVRVTEPGYHAEVDAALEMATGIYDGAKKTMGADKGYDRDEFTDGLRELNMSSHVAQNIHRSRHQSSIDNRTTRHEGYQISQRKRKRVEEIFGWLKSIGLMRRPMYRGLERISWAFTFSLSVYNLIRIKNLCAA